MQPCGQLAEITNNTDTKYTPYVVFCQRLYSSSTLVTQNRWSFVAVIARHEGPKQSQEWWVGMYAPVRLLLCARNDDEGVSLVMSLVVTSERASHNDGGLSPICPN